MNPLSLRTNCSDAARISSSVAGGSKLKSVLMFRHISSLSDTPRALVSPDSSVMRALPKMVTLDKPRCSAPTRGAPNPEQELPFDSDLVIELTAFSPRRSCPFELLSDVEENHLAYRLTGVPAKRYKNTLYGRRRDPELLYPNAAVQPNVTFEDRLGTRFEAVSPEGDPVEVLELKEQFANVPSFEFALRKRVNTLTSFRDPSCATARGVRLGGGLAVVSDRVRGTRLSTVLEAYERDLLPIEFNAAVCVLRQLVPAIAIFHETMPEICHGAIVAGADRHHSRRARGHRRARARRRRSRSCSYSDQQVLGRAAHRGAEDRGSDVLRPALRRAADWPGRARADPRAFAEPRGVSGAGRRRSPSARGPRRRPADSSRCRPALRMWLNRTLQLEPKQAFNTATAVWSELKHALPQSSARELQALKVGARALRIRFAAGAADAPPRERRSLPLQHLRPSDTAARDSGDAGTRRKAHDAPGGREARHAGARRPARDARAGSRACDDTAGHPAGYDAGHDPGSHASCGVASDTGSNSGSHNRADPRVGTTDAVADRRRTARRLATPTPAKPLQVPATVKSAAPKSEPDDDDGLPHSMRGNVRDIMAAHPPENPDLIRTERIRPASNDDSGQLTRGVTPSPWPKPQSAPAVPDAPMEASTNRFAIQEEEQDAMTHDVPWWRRRSVAAAMFVMLAAGVGVAGRSLLSPSADAAVPGTLVVETNPPGVAVVLDGKRSGQTPVTLEVAAGSHVVDAADRANAADDSRDDRRRRHRVAVRRGPEADCRDRTTADSHRAVGRARRRRRHASRRRAGDG